MITVRDLEKLSDQYIEYLDILTERVKDIVNIIEDFTEEERERRCNST